MNFENKMKSEDSTMNYDVIKEFLQYPKKKSTQMKKYQNINNK